MEDKIVMMLFALGVVLIVLMIPMALTKSEVAECLKLQQYAEDYPDFYLTSWQDQMCRHHKVEVVAPVK